MGPHLCHDFGKNTEVGLLQRGILLATSLIMALDLPQSLVRSKKGNTWSHYRRGWLTLGVLTALPFFTMVLALTGRIGGVAELLTLLGLQKNWKIRHYFVALRLRALRPANALTVSSLLFWAALTVHWIAIGWLWLRGHDPGLSYLSNYLDALYWTGTTLTTVGYGDIIPTPDTEKV